jgi:integrase
MMELDKGAALVPVSSSTELALLESLAEQAEEIAEKARADRTRATYEFWWSKFAAWCDRHRIKSLPADVGTVVLWLTDLSVNGSGARVTKTGKVIPSHGLARASLNQALAALQAKFRDAGCPVDRRNPALARFMAGMQRTKKVSVRKAAPFTIDDLLDLLPQLNIEANWGARHACMATLGFGAALRRSELVGLNWLEIREDDKEATGYVSMDARGILVTLVRSKASQTEAVEIAISRADLPEACEALERWVKMAEIKPGDPLLRAVTKGNVVSSTRLTAQSVALIMKGLAADLAVYRSEGKKTWEQAKTEARVYSGHSLRAGYATSAADAKLHITTIAAQTRHQTLSVLQGYIRNTERWGEGSGLRGIRGKKASQAETSD